MFALRIISLLSCLSLGVTFVQSGAYSRQPFLAATASEQETMPEVKVGDRIPPVIMMEGLEDFGKEEINISELIGGKKVAIFGVPGAFTPGCSKSHLPSFIDAQDELKAKGVEMTICVATNDLFVMEVSSFSAESVSALFDSYVPIVPRS